MQPPIQDDPSANEADKVPIANATKQADSHLTVEHRTDRSLLMMILHTVLKPIRPQMVKPRKIVHGGSPRLTPPKSVSQKCHLEERQVDGIWIYDITSNASQNGSRHEPENISNSSPQHDEVVKNVCITFVGAGGSRFRARVTGP